MNIRLNESPSEVVATVFEIKGKENIAKLCKSLDKLIAKSLHPHHFSSKKDLTFQQN